MTTPSQTGSGVFPIQYALFDEDGRLWREGMRQQIEYCIQMKPAGIATLGLATETRELSDLERQHVLEWNLEDIDGRLPLGATIFADTVAEEISALEHAASAGASWAILQPPREARNNNELMAMFSAIIDKSPLPVAIQNAPAFVGVGLSPMQLVELTRRHPNLVAVKQEVSATETAALREAVGERLQIFGGRGGLELIDGLRAGIDGTVPAPEYADRILSIWQSAHDGEAEAAYAAYARILPLATFIMQDLSTLITYGKLLLCARIGIPCHQRNQAMRATKFGLAAIEDHCRHAGISADFASAAADLGDEL